MTDILKQIDDIDSTLKLYHGSPYYFDHFDIQGLKNNDSNMAVTAGYYFTTSLDEAYGYAMDKNDNGHIYKIELSDFQNEHKTGEEPKILSEKGLLIDLDNEEQKISVTSSNIVNILKKLPKDALIEKMNDFFDFSSGEFKFLSEKEKVNLALSKIAKQYQENFKNDFLYGFNILGNDFFNDSNEIMDLYNKVVSDKFNIFAFVKDRSYEGKTIHHYIVLDKDRMPELKHYYAKEASLKIEAEKALATKLKQDKIKEKERLKKEEYKKHKKSNFKNLLKFMVLKKESIDHINKIKENSTDSYLSKLSELITEAFYEEFKPVQKIMLSGFIDLDKKQLAVKNNDKNSKDINMFDLTMEYFLLNVKNNEGSIFYKQKEKRDDATFLYESFERLKHEYLDYKLGFDKYESDFVNENPMSWKDFVSLNINETIKEIYLEEIGYKIDKKLTDQHKSNLEVDFNL